MLYQVFLDVRNAAARILEHTTLADIVGPKGPRKSTERKGEDASVLPMPAHGRRGKDA